jgi:hypothetical protein
MPRSGGPAASLWPLTETVKSKHLGGTRCTSRAPYGFEANTPLRGELTARTRHRDKRNNPMRVRQLSPSKPDEAFRGS